MSVRIPHVRDVTKIINFDSKLVMNFPLLKVNISAASQLDHKKLTKKKKSYLKFDIYNFFSP